MLQDTPAGVAYCDEGARHCRQKAEEATTLDQKEEHLARLSHTVREVDARSGDVVAVARHGVSLDPEGVYVVTAAYDTVLAELNLSHREDAGTLMVAKRVIELAASGEHEPQRLADAALDALCR